jgi:hypothetical protein
VEVGQIRQIAPAQLLHDHLIALVDPLGCKVEGKRLCLIVTPPAHAAMSDIGVQQRSDQRWLRVAYDQREQSQLVGLEVQQMELLPAQSQHT